MARRNVIVLDSETGEQVKETSPAERTHAFGNRPPPPETIPVLATADERIAFIADLMREFAWPSFPASLQFRKRLSDAWGVSDSSIRSYSAQAHRLIEVDPQDRLDIARDVAEKCDAVFEDAINHVSEQTGLPDYANALKALEMKAKYLGAEPPKEVKHSGNVSLTAVDEMRKALEGE